MNALFIGGTGTISASISRLLIDMGWELTLINRGNRMEITHWDRGHPLSHVVSFEVFL